MKRLLSIIFAVIMLVSLAACSNNKESDNNSSGDLDKSQQSSTEKQEAVPQATIEETVLYDTNDIKITALSLTYDDYYVNLNLLVENNTGTNLTFQASETTVNDFVQSPTMSFDVAAGQQSEGELSFMKKWLSNDYIDVIADIETKFRYFSSDFSYSVNEETELIRIETSAASTFDYSYDESGTVIHDGDGVKIVCQKIFTTSNTTDGVTRHYPVIYIKNNRDENCYVEIEEAYVNGVEIESILGEFVYPDKRMLVWLEFYESDLEENGITEIESLELSFEITRNALDNNGVKTELVEVEL